jgi:hypothetical protein
MGDDSPVGSSDGGVSNDEDSVVELGGRASLGIIDARLVELEAGKTGIHGNGDGANIG